MVSESTVFYVLCPECGARVPLPPQAVGPSRSDLWNVVACCNCCAPLEISCEEILSMLLTEWQELILPQAWAEAP